jgi:hypothetical protein
VNRLVVDFLNNESDVPPPMVPSAAAPVDMAVHAN